MGLRTLAVERLTATHSIEVMLFSMVAGTDIVAAWLPVSASMTVVLTIIPLSVIIWSLNGRSPKKTPGLSAPVTVQLNTCMSSLFNPTMRD